MVSNSKVNEKGVVMKAIKQLFNSSQAFLTSVDIDDQPVKMKKRFLEAELQYLKKVVGRKLSTLTSNSSTLDGLAGRQPFSQVSS